MFKDRLISGIIMLIIIISFVLLGGYFLFALMTCISLIGLFELYRVYGLEKTPIALVSYAVSIIFYILVQFNDNLYELGLGKAPLLILFIVYFMIMLSFYVFSYPKYRIDQITNTVFGVLYVPIMLSFILLTRNSHYQRGLYFVWLIFICSWGCDTCAYCVGKLIGKHKMSPVLSPKKSIEGAIGGIVGAVILAWCLFLFMQYKGIIGFDIAAKIVVTVLVACAAFISMVGDLAASAIKRNYDIKDYGTLIPGHGGILDRFDSVIITAPIIYIISLL